MFYRKKIYQKKLLQKNIFEYSPLGDELKKQTGVAKKQYQKLDKVYEFDKKEEDKIKKID